MLIHIKQMQHEGDAWNLTILMPISSSHTQANTLLPVHSSSRLQLRFLLLRVSEQ
jgi:hypothetical protein